MGTDVDFGIWCARQCLHLWDPPEEVKSWLADPKPEQATKVADMADEARTTIAVNAAEAAGWSATWATGPVEAAAWAAGAVEAAAWAVEAAAWIAKAAEHTAKALDTTPGQLRLDYVATWTDDELARAEGEWIEPATVEVFDRKAKAS